MTKPKNAGNKAPKEKQPAAPSRAEGELGSEALDQATGGAGNTTTVNTYRVDPYKNFKFH